MENYIESVAMPAEIAQLDNLRTLPYQFNDHPPQIPRATNFRPERAHTSKNADEDATRIEGDTPPSLPDWNRTTMMMSLSGGLFIMEEGLYLSERGWTQYGHHSFRMRNFLTFLTKLT
ncbi:hypothetical protein CEXT_169781 [Caerostris extrusa]|uniref:Uncharacterized protein n=1 Tax=Caerostris extrusa TaxID=172846 RepID=A0AAV4UN71_CAEEX|nr:hypothetical protein CEXT_169781 [Caerostris extrusa]